MKLKDVVKLLQAKDQNLEVEYIVVEMDTSIVSMHLTSETCDMLKLLKAFKQQKETK